MPKYTQSCFTFPGLCPKKTRKDKKNMLIAAFISLKSLAPRRKKKKLFVHAVCECAAHVCGPKRAEFVH